MYRLLLERLKLILIFLCIIHIVSQIYILVKREKTHFPICHRQLNISKWQRGFTLKLIQNFDVYDTLKIFS